MSILKDLISQIDNADLRARIATEVDKLAKQKKFGLVFEEHLPECTPLYDIPVKKGGKVALKAGKVNEVYTVLKIEDGKALCLNKDKSETEEFAVDEIVSVAEFGEAIYPCLKPIDSVCNAPDSDLWHTLIEADNYHALQLLEYLYAGKVDCIYIDPPYNKEDSKDWSYNCNYVDGSDSYRHSKWLSMMQKRLKIAKRLLNPLDSALIVTIDEEEYLHLGCLLEEMFPEARIQMISSIINPTGSKRADEFSRTNEFIYYVRLGSCSIEQLEVIKTVSENSEVHWEPLRRHNAGNLRTKTNTQFYPIYININTNKIVEIGEPVPKHVDVKDIPSKDGCETVLPIRDNGLELMWGMKADELKSRLSSGYVRIGAHTPNKPQKYIISYLTTGTIEDIESGKATTAGYDENGVIKAYYKEGKKVIPTTQWSNSSYDSKVYGTLLLQPVFGDRFSFPKSLYAVLDCLRLVVSQKPNALIVDFFAGSGTTLHAVNLLNALDDGHRRCIIVTNNEVNKEATRNELKSKGYNPGDEEWEKLGIARYVTWPRTVCSILGKDVHGKPITGFYGAEKEDYILDETKGSYKKKKVQLFPELSELKWADGFKANAAYFKLGFLDKTKVSLGMQFKEMLPTLWMKAGAIGKCPTVKEALPDILILPENKFAVLLDEKAYMEFAAKLDEHPEIETAYIITDSESGYRDMIAGLNVKASYQLYRDYLDNFRINSVRR